MRHRFLALSIVFVTLGCSQSYKYVSASVDADGTLNVLTSDGVTVRPPLAKGQSGVADPAVSSDQRAVGWLALYPNDATSYPIPLRLIVLSRGGRRELAVNGQMIGAWAFVDSSATVAFESGTVHGEHPSSYELHAVPSGKLLAAYDSQRDGPIAPAWVRAVEAAHK